MRCAMTLSRSCGIAIVLLLLTAGGCGPKGSAAPAAGQAVPLKDQMRPLWQPSAPMYPRDFLVCGPFFESVRPPASAGSQPSTAPAATQPAAPEDFLAPAGGEANVRPKEGEVFVAKDGTRFTWVAYSAKTDLIDVREACPAARERPCVTYAYATIHRDNPGMAILSLASRAPATVYLNGKVVFTPDDMQSSPVVPLVKGDNALVVRLAGQSDRWTFTLGVREQVDIPTGSRALIGPSIVSGRNDKTELAVKVRNDNRLAPPTVTLEVLGPAGQVAGRAEVPAGQTHVFNISKWPDGPYEIRTLAPAPDGSPVAKEMVWYKGDWQQGVADVLKDAERLPADSDDPVVLKKRLARRYPSVPSEGVGGGLRRHDPAG